MSFPAIHIARIGRSPVLGLWLGIALLSALLQLAGLERALTYDRALIDAGQWWLLISCHFVHTGWSHWSLNMAGLAIVAVFFSRYGSVPRWLLVVLVSALFAGAGSYLFNPELDRAVGLSAVLHGLFVYGALCELPRDRVGGSVLLALLAAKLLWEFFRGAMPGSELLAGGAVATEAHLYGALGGLTAWCVLLGRDNWLYCRRA